MSKKKPFISVQPMSKPVGLAYAIRWVFGATEEDEEGKWIYIEMRKSNENKTGRRNLLRNRKLS